MSQTIFERYGGFASVSRIVSSFYNKIIDSPVTSPYFSSTNMKRLIDHQTKFIASMMGGPASYTNDHLERVHAHLGITETAFMEAVDMLMETLEDFNFADEDMEQVEREVMSRKNFIVKRG
ncbi:MAG: group I truncated hemoglobin [Anaerolineales bacterium]|jgi:hemoglobin